MTGTSSRYIICITLMLCPCDRDQSDVAHFSVRDSSAITDTTISPLNLILQHTTPVTVQITCFSISVFLLNKHKVFWKYLLLKKIFGGGLESYRKLFVHYPMFYNPVYVKGNLDENLNKRAFVFFKLQIAQVIAEYIPRLLQHRHSNASQIQKLRYKSVSQKIQFQNIPNEKILCQVEVCFNMLFLANFEFHFSFLFFFF